MGIKEAVQGTEAEMAFANTGFYAESIGKINSVPRGQAVDIWVWDVVVPRWC